jgi:hypothetical protein
MPTPGTRRTAPDETDQTRSVSLDRPSPTASPTAPPREAAVRRALRSLIDGPVPADPAGPVDLSRASAIVAAAHEALAALDSAAAFVADGGLDRLRDAIEAADRAGDRETARAGQRALATVQRYRRAASGDHFHPGRGTVFRPGGEVSAE